MIMNPNSHKPLVGGSNPPATTKRTTTFYEFPISQFLCIIRLKR
jgi:hypothetical protein